MTTLATVPARTRRIGPLDMLWLTWRQHRIAIVIGAVLAAAFYAVALAVGTHEFPSGIGLAWIPRWVLVEGLVWLGSAVGLLLGVFWAAPLIAREYEQRTDVLAWGQDVSVTGWLFGKVAVLGVVAVGYATVVAFAVSGLVAPLHMFWLPFYRANFESAVPVQLAYALFGFLLGVAVSAFVRRTVPAMASTAVLFVVVRFVVYELRFTYIPPVDITVPPLHTPLPDYTPFTDLLVQYHTVFVAGRPTAIFYYQPAERLTAFRLIEIAIFVVLAAALALTAWLRMRRAATSR